MGSTSYHIVSLIIDSLGEGHTHAHAHTYTDILTKAILRNLVYVSPYREIAQGVTWHIYLTFLGYLPCIIVTRVEKSWSFVWQSHP